MACSNKNCISKEFLCEPHFDLRVSLSDCTGTISGVRITGQVAMELLNKSTVSVADASSIVTKECGVNIYCGYWS